MATIGFDASRLLIAERTGTETYSAEILRALAELVTDDELVVYLNAPRLPPTPAGDWAARNLGGPILHTP